MGIENPEGDQGGKRNWVWRKKVGLRLTTTREGKIGDTIIDRHKSRGHMRVEPEKKSGLYKRTKVFFIQNKNL